MLVPRHIGLIPLQPLVIQFLILSWLKQVMLPNLRCKPSEGSGNERSGETFKYLDTGLKLAE